uniref:Glycosyltransferase family 1 protein n=1 Tax=candidate division WWE3 bacterium TaxID=2053526 RepID=A0A832DRN0_UNCKA
MRVAIDAQTLLRQNAGVTYYTKGLVEEVLKQDRRNHYDLLLWRLFPKPPVFMFGKEQNFFYRYQRFFPYRFFYKLHKWGINIPLEVFFPPSARASAGEGRYDLYFFPDFVIYPHRFGRSVVVVHDLSFEKTPQFVFKENVKFLKKFVPLSVRQADRVIAISENTKEDLREVYGIPEEKVTVINPGVDLKVFRPQGREEATQIKNKYGITRPFILYLGTIDSRKNVAALVRAYANLRDRTRYQLVLAGKVGWTYEHQIDREVQEVVKNLKLEEDVIFTGYTPDEDRPKLLSACEVFVFPSFFEGFGMPVVEAQACGAPVVASNTTSLPEAAGAAAVLVDPRNEGELGEAIRNVLGSPKLQEDLRRRGFENSRRFRWEDSAVKLMRVFYSLG